MAFSLSSGVLLFAVEGAADSVRQSVEVTLVDDAVTGYATFQSHNQKVVSGPHGIFLTYIRTRNESYTAQAWRLVRSVDGGKTFRTVYESVDPTNPPALELGPGGDLFLARPDFVDGNAYLYRFSAADDFTKPVTTVIPKAAAGKYAMVCDPGRQRLFYFSHNNSFHEISLSGEVIRSVTLLQRGESADLQYPLLSLSAAGHLHAGWTTQKHDVYLYWDIHHMVSKDGGQRWYSLDGRTLDLPVVADDPNAAQRVTLDDEYSSHTWLSSMMARGGKLHFLYLAQTKPPRQNYVRFDSASGVEDHRIAPKFAGGAIELRGLSGFFASRGSEEKGTLVLRCFCRGANRVPFEFRQRQPMGRLGSQ